VLPPLSKEFGVSETTVRYTTMITFVGLSIGSSFWGIASDIIGRRPAFNATLFICGMFGSLVALGPSWITTSLLFGCMGLGVGGNLPVDGALFLEFLPFASSGLLTLLSIWWPVGQVIASLIAWAVIPLATCEPWLESCPRPDGAPCCESKDNRGWRYFIGILGGITLLMFICRYFIFHMYESPKFLLSKGRQAQAVTVIRHIAAYNGKTTWLSEELLNDLGGHDTEMLGIRETTKRNLNKFSFAQLKPLFKGWKLAFTTSLLWFIWAAIGMGYPLFNAFLPQYLEHSGEKSGSGPIATNVVSLLAENSRICTKSYSIGL
jgi:MFS family permease